MKITFVPSNAPKFIQIEGSEVLDLEQQSPNDFLIIKCSQDISEQVRRKFPQAVVLPTTPTVEANSERLSINLGLSGAEIVEKYVDYKKGGKELVELGKKLLEEALQ
jgi:hypothetical protein